MSQQVLGAELWGERVTRARRRSRVNLKDAAEEVSRFWPVSHTTVGRLEDLDEAPPDERRRAVAILTLLVYGFDPADFGLSIDELPSAIDRKRLAELELRMSRWTEQLPA